MKKSDLLDQFYIKRKNFITRLFLLTLFIILLITALIKIQARNDFIAKISVEGVIQDRSDLVGKINDLVNNKKVKGLITIVNSPGGTYVGSKELYDSIRKLGKKVPTVVYMREIATSGGYLVALSSDKIFGNEGTITGSVGVILQTADITKLLEKIGINPVIVKSGELKAVPNPAEKLNDEKLNYLREVIQNMQREFLELVKLNRNISKSVLEIISDGRILTGKDAKKLELIDYVGNESDAIKWLKNEAKVDDDIQIVDFSIEKDLGSILGLSFFKKKFNYLEQNFYNGFVAIWAPGL